MRRLALLLALALSFCQPCSAANSIPEAINLNNEGVKALNEKNWLLAVNKLNAAIKLDADYELPKENLEIAHNMWGEALMKEKKHEEALKHFCQAFYLNDVWENNSYFHASTLAHISESIKALGKDPRNFGDRIALADKAKSEGDLASAVVEYDAAVHIKDVPNLHKKIGDLYRQLEQPDKAAEEEKLAGSANK